MPETITEKRCTHCGLTKPLELFSKNSRNAKTGRQAWCKACHSEHEAASRAAFSNQMTVREHTRTMVAAPPRPLPVTPRKPKPPVAPPGPPPSIEREALFAMLGGGRDDLADRKLQLAAHILDIQAEILRELVK